VAELSSKLVAITLIVWAAVAVASVAMVVYGGAMGVIFAFVAITTAVGAWAKVVNRAQGAPEEDELAKEIKELANEIRELKKLLEE